MRTRRAAAKAATLPLVAGSIKPKPDDGTNAPMRTRRVLRGELTPEPGKARIRVIHAATGTKELDIALSGHKEELFSNLHFGTHAGFKDIDPTSSALVVRPADEPTALATIHGMELEPGVAYTIVIVREPMGAIKAITFADEPIRHANGLTLNR
jgi:hypothetical protein